MSERSGQPEKNEGDGAGLVGRTGGEERPSGLESPSSPRPYVTTGRWVTFTDVSMRTQKTGRWSVHGSAGADDYLGLIRWHGPWRQYVLVVTQPSIYNPACLREIEEFIVERMRERRG